MVFFEVTMRVNIKRIDKTLPLPVYETEGSVGFDILIRENSIVAPKSLALLPGNIIVETPEGYMLMIASRSSTPKKGLTPPHGIGVIDNDYCGENDEVKVLVYNFTEEEVEIKRGDKLAQGIFVRVDKPEIIEVDEVKKKSRGGFGSTNK
jgi:dUTP pyrophosphatase